MLPKISGNSNFSNIMDAYKKSFYNKKFSNDVHFSGIQGKKAYWSLILSSKFKYHFLRSNYYLGNNISPIGKNGVYFFSNKTEPLVTNFQ